MPERTWTWDDLVRGEVSFAHEHVPDFVIVRGNGEPLYTLVNPVDDALMGITHVLRGEDLLSSTPRQLAMYEALAAIGVGDGTTPRFGHLPYVMGEGNKKLSKRDPQSSLNLYREQGYLPEGLLNYLALLGWSAGDDLEFFSPAELAALFDLDRVQPNPARFDSKKCLAINGDWIRHIDAADLARRMVPYLDAVGAIDGTPTAAQQAVVDAAVPLVQERMETLRAGADQLRFLLVRGGRVRGRHRGPRAGPHRGVARRAEGGIRRAGDPRALRARGGRGGPARGARGRSRAQAEGGLRAGPRGRQRPTHLATAVRVDRAARPRAHPRPARCGAGLIRRARAGVRFGRGGRGGLSFTASSTREGRRPWGMG